MPKKPETRPEIRDNEIDIVAPYMLVKRVLRYIDAMQDRTFTFEGTLIDKEIRHLLEEQIP